MQKAEVILSMLSRQSKNDEDYTFKRLYRNLFNQNLYIKAYQIIYAKQGIRTGRIDEKTISSSNYEEIDKIIRFMKSESYYPKPVKKVYIPKKSGMIGSLGISLFRDKLVQEVLRQLLEAIYEPLFSENSHGFRPNKSPLTALYQIKTKSRGASWVVKGSIKDCFDNIDHNILLKLLAKKIDDGRFIELIRRFLQNGYMEFYQVHNSLSGIPQSQAFSPILANIYLNALDRYVESLINRYSKGSCQFGEELPKRVRKTSSQIAENNGYVGANYIRCADNWLLCVNGDKTIATEIKNKIGNFLKSELNLELNQEETLVINLKDNNARFLGYEISKSNCDTLLNKNIDVAKRYSVNGTMQLLVPNDVITEKLKSFTQNNKSIHHNARVNLPVLDIIEEYNSEIRELYNYYCMAADVSAKIGKFKYFHYYSMAKTIALKEKISVREVIAKYGIDVPLKQGTGTRKIIGIRYKTRHGEKILTYFDDRIKKMERIC